jgi:hypothetical protein
MTFGGTHWSDFPLVVKPSGHRHRSFQSHPKRMDRLEGGSASRPDGPEPSSYSPLFPRMLAVVEPKDLVWHSSPIDGLSVHLAILKPGWLPSTKSLSGKRSTHHPGHPSSCCLEALHGSPAPCSFRLFWCHEVGEFAWASFALLGGWYPPCDALPSRSRSVEIASWSPYASFAWSSSARKIDSGDPTDPDCDHPVQSGRDEDEFRPPTIESSNIKENPTTSKPKSDTARPLLRVSYPTSPKSSDWPWRARTCFFSWAQCGASRRGSAWRIARAADWVVSTTA